MTTVFFATNRVLSGPPDDPRSYLGATIQPPSSPAAMVYGSAFVDGTDITTNTQGVLNSLQATALGQFPAGAASDLADAGRNILVFLHGFDNSFADSITRAAFNRDWLAASGLPGTDTSVVVFCWPSIGKAIEFPVLTRDYLIDQNTARASGYHMMEFMACLQPILTAARTNGQRTFLLAHSMGALVLQSAVESWFQHGNGAAPLFDCAALCAGDCEFNAFGQPNLAGLAGLPLLAGRVAVYYSHVDAVLQLSSLVNDGARRLGQDGPRNRTDAGAFPPDEYVMVDATGFRDYPFGFLASHQYYRRSPACRARLAADMAGQ